MTDNQLAVAAGIENVYDVTLTGPFAGLVAELFTLDALGLVNAFDQLSGVEYPNYLNAIRNKSFVINTLRLGPPRLLDHVRGIDKCRTPSYGGRVWIMGRWNSAKLDSNDNAIGYDADNWAGTLGGEYRMGNFAIGAFVGYRNVDVDFPDALVGSSIEANGWQLGLTAKYDVGDLYIRGIGSYSSLDGDSERGISIGTIVGSALGDPDVNVWSFYAEGGGRFNVGESSWLTPYVAIDYTSMKLRSFTESASPEPTSTSTARRRASSPDLSASSGQATSAASCRKRRSPIAMTSAVILASTPLCGSPAEAISARKKSVTRARFVAGLSLAGTFGSNFSGRIGYLGQFSDEYKDHAVYGLADIALRRCTAAAAAAASASAASSGDADLPGRLGDPGDGHLSAAAAAAASAAAGAGARVKD